MDTQTKGSLVEVDPAVWLHDGWKLARSAPGIAESPGALLGTPMQWHDAVVPGTVAASLRHDVGTPGDFDAHDWWYVKSFALPWEKVRSQYLLRFDGLATLAHVWLNGSPILTSRNMFTSQRVDVTHLLRDKNELVIRFESLDAALAPRRARPRWKTALVDQQNLRWIRTTLLGRMPGWTPPVAPVGPWGPIALERVERAEVRALSIHAHAEETTGRLSLRGTAVVLEGHHLEEARLTLGETPYPVAIDGVELHCDLTLPDVKRWSPHTHGLPHLLPWSLELRVDGEWRRADSGSIGFKDLHLDDEDGKIRFRVNGIPIFCRGACWTPVDFLNLHAEPGKLRQALEQARDAGVNMIRIGGTLLYESDEFYRICDELGILVWQDFMFANMDYPFADPDFRVEAEAEVRQQLRRFQRHACIAAYCGGSEIAQQAAMLGLPADEWCNEFFAEALPAHCEELHPGIPYFPSTPWGGAMPFHIATGISHYYGVGAYRRPIADARNARVKFAAECLGFSNVPDAPTMALLFDGAIPPPHHPRWKARVPRDSGSGYDFEDVRDHYLRQLFEVDPMQLRSNDLERYYAVSRVVSGEVMGRVFAEWRAPASDCGGALVWNLRDLMPGAGWGIVDSTGRPKAAWWYLKRAWAPLAVRITDEGLDGLALHALNEHDVTIDAIVELQMYKDGAPAARTASAAVTIPPRGCVTLQGDALLGFFIDSSNAYRFGPPKHDVVAVRLLHAGTRAVLSEDFQFPAGMNLAVQRGATVEAEAHALDDGKVEVILRSTVFLQAVAITCEGYRANDDYFHLSPNREKRIEFVPEAGEPRDFKAYLEALNLAEGITVRLRRPQGEPR
jgi:beta-mannosidase